MLTPSVAVEFNNPGLITIWGQKGHCALLKNALIMKGANLFYKSQILSISLIAAKPCANKGFIVKNTPTKPDLSVKVRELA